MDITEKNLKSAARRCFQSFLDTPIDKTNPLQKALSIVGHRLDKKIADGSISTDDISDYELAAMKLAYNAGFRAAAGVFLNR